MRMEHSSHYSLVAHPHDRSTIAGGENLLVELRVARDANAVDGPLTEGNFDPVSQRAVGALKHVQLAIVRAANDCPGRRIQRNGVHENSASEGNGRVKPLSAILGQ